VEVRLLCEGREFTFSGEEDDIYFKVWRDRGFYGGERDLAPYRIILKPDDVCVDVGGNIGLTAVLTGALAPKGKAYFFEPDPKNFKHLKRTIEANGFDNFVAINAAVGAEPGRLMMNHLASSSHAALFPQENQFEIELVTIDGWAKSVKLEKLDFLKIDVEGLEKDVLIGAKETIQRFKPVALIECNVVTTIMVGRILPYDLIAEIFLHFPYVEVIDLYTGHPRRLENTPEAINGFVGENMLNGFVHDLLCYFDPKQIRRPTPLVGATAEASRPPLDVARAELKALTEYIATQDDVIAAERRLSGERLRQLEAERHLSGERLRLLEALHRERDELRKSAIVRFVIATSKYLRKMARARPWSAP
jgi:FkbM family methyltransferase